MVERAVDILIRGKDFTAPAFKAAANAVEGFSRALGKTRRAARDLIIIGQGITGVLSKLKQGFDASVNAVEGQLKAETRLAISLGRVTKDIDAQVKVYRSWSGEIQRATGIEDDHTLAMAATLQSTGAMPATVRRATQALVDYSAATGRSMTEALEPMRRALGGQQAQWSRLGIAVDQSLPPQQQALEVTKQLEERFGGAAKAIGETAYGSILRFKAAVGDLREMLGYAIIKTDLFNNVLDVLGFHLGEIDQEARSNQVASMLDTLFKGALNGARAAINGLLYFAEIVVRVLDGIRTGIGYVAEGIAGFADAVSGNTAIKALGVDLTGVSEGFQSLSQSIANNGDQFADWSTSLRGAREDVTKFFDALTKTNERAQDLREGGVGMDGLGKFGEQPMPEPQADLAESLQVPTEALSDFERALDSVWIKWDAFQYTGLTFASEMSAAFFSISDSMANSVGTLLVDLREKAISSGEAIQKMGDSIANQALASMGRAITKVILAPLDFALQKFTELVTKMIWGAAVEKALAAETSAANLALKAEEATAEQTIQKASLAATLAAVIPVAAALEAAWLPAATFASIATFGAASLAGAAGVSAALTQVAAAATALKAAAAVPLAEGGFVSGPTLAMVGEGRYPETVQPLRPGSAMEALSKANGADEFFGGGGPSIGTLNLTVNGNSGDPRELADAVSAAIARELRLLAGRRYA